MNKFNDNEKTINNCKQFLINITSENIWSTFRAETKTDLLTAQICFDYIKEIGYDLDYSSVIAPLMKCLEHELTQIYYVGYLEYLKSKYSVQDFINIIDKNCNGDAIDERPKLLCRDEKQTAIFLEVPDNEFTIGNFRFIIGVKNLRKKWFDEPFIDYVKILMKSEQKISTVQLCKGLKQLVDEIEALQFLRNGGVHGGKTQNYTEAKNTMEDLIEVKQVLLTIVTPIRLLKK